MQIIKLYSPTGNNGILHLVISVEIASSDIEVEVTI